ncbi:MAG: DNA adenine methylase [Fimbriimonadaceae bacterium]|nr:DNA adenine methylase [Fimbriimonadaceae bacterium]
MGCTVQHVRLLVRDGKIKGERIGRDWLVDEQSVHDFAERRYPKSEPDAGSLGEPTQVATLFPEPELQPIVNVASVPHRSPFRYPGGKTWLVPIARLWLDHLRHRADRLVEPFAGGGGIGLAAVFEGYVRESLLVELDPDVAAVWRTILSDDGPRLAGRIRKFKPTIETVAECLGTPASDALGMAFQTILRNRVSRGGILAPGAGLIKTGEAGRGLASRWYPETLARRIEAIHERRKDIRFAEADGLVVLRQCLTDPKEVFFVDPPYPVAGKRLYRMHDLNHRFLFELLAEARGEFLATYDNNPVIQALAGEFGFETRLVPMKSTHHEKKWELLISRSLDWLPTNHYPRPSGSVV